MNSSHYARELEFYYIKAKPELLAPAIAAMARDGTLNKNDRLLFMASFLAALIREGKLEPKNIFKICDKKNAAQRRLAAWTIHLAGRPASGKQLEEFLAQDPTLLKQLRSTPAPLEKLNPASESTILEMYWAAFFATGKFKWLNAIIDLAQRWEKNKRQGLDTLPAGSRAASTLYEFSPRHEKIRQNIKKRLQNSEPDEREFFKIILAQ